MHSHFTSFLLDLKEPTISNAENINDNFHIHVQPVEYLQSCLQCKEKDVIRKDFAYQRKVPHLSAFVRRIYLLFPFNRLCCKTVNLLFSGSMTVWNPERAIPKSSKTHCRVRL